MRLLELSDGEVSYLKKIPFFITILSVLILSNDFISIEGNCIGLSSTHLIFVSV